MELPYDPSIPLLGIHPEETRIERDTCTPMFIVALFIIARTWKQPRCPSPSEHIKKLIHYFANKGPSSQSYGFSSSHVWMWGLDYKESWVPKNWCFELWCWIRLLRVPWTASRSNQSILQEISPEYSLEGLMMKLNLPDCGHVMQKNWLVGKDPDAGKDWRQDEKGMTEDEMVGWHHQLYGFEFG